MPRSKEKKKREQPSNAAFISAVKDVVENHYSVRGAAEKYGISKSALARHVSAFKDSGASTYEYAPKYDVKKVFTEAQETMLVEYMKQAAYMHYGLTILDLRRLAYEFAKENKVKYPTKWDEDKLAGEGWTRLFRQRHSSELSLRKPEATSLSRATSFNKHNVGLFFSNYIEVLGRSQFGPERIYNLDETGLSTVQNPPKVLAPKGVKAIGGMTSAERGTNVSMIAAVNALGNTVPPLFVFPRVHFKSNMLKRAPPGSIGAAAPSGWSNEDIFNQYFEHFVRHAKPTIESPVILLLDNHESHVSVRAITLGKKVGVHMVTFYPHTSHKMQPLDRTVFGPFKTYYHKAITDWMSSPGNQGKPLTIYDVAEIAGKVYSKAFTPANITEGFKVTGIFPLDQDIFKDHEFLPANVTDRPAPTCNPCLEDRQVQQPSELQQPTTSSDVQSSQHLVNGPSTSKSTCLLNPLSPQSSPQAQPASTIITPEMLRPFPKAEARKGQQTGTTTRRPKGKSKIMTDTPEKDEIENLKKIKMEGKQRKGGHNKENALRLKREKMIKLQREKVNKVRLNLKKIFNKEKDSSDEDLPNFDDQMNENPDDPFELSDEDYPEAIELEKNLNLEELKNGDYVLVEHEGKKSVVKHFVANITERLDKETFCATYLVKCLDSDKFKAKSSDVFDISAKDIKLKLPEPHSHGGTARLQNQLKFSVSFSGYNVG